MPWTLTDVRGSLPNKLTKNSVNNDISKRNAYEHVTALYNELHALREEMRKAGEVPQVIDNLFKNVRNLKYVLDGTRLPDDRKENAKTSLEDGSFKNNLEQFYLELEKEAGIVTKDAKKKIQLKQLVQYLNYALHLESEKIPENEEYKLNYRSVENKIGQDKEQEAENAEQIDRYNADVDRYFVYGNSARTAIERMQRELLSPEFENKTEDERISLIAAILSARAAAGSVMGKASTLREMDKEEFAENYIGLMKSASFRSFIADQGVRGLQRLMTGRTHGGNLEKAFTDFYVRRLDLYDPIPSRFAPKTSAVIEALKQDVLDYDKGGEFLARTMAHIFAARIVTGAKRGESSSVNKKLNLPTFRDQSLKIFGSQTFKQFVNDNENALITLCRKRGHGGAMHEMMQKSIAKMKTLPLDGPTEYMPTTKQRIAELQKIIKSNAFKTMDFEEKKEALERFLAD